MKRLLPLLVLVSGCVSAAKFKASESSLKESRALAASLSKDLDAARSSLSALDADLGSAKASIASLSASEAELKTRLGESEAKLASASDQVSSLQKSVSDLRQSLEANKGELTRKVSELIKEKDAIGRRLASTESSAAQVRAAKERELSELGRGKTELESRLKELQDRLLAAEKEKESLQSEKAELQKAKDAELAAVTRSYEELTSGLKAEISAGEVTISSLKGKLTVNLVDRILFDSGSAEVKPAGRKVLARVGELLNQVRDKDIRIEGHTDNVPISGELRGRYPSNWELSTARATAVARYLQDHAKVDPARLVAAGLGEWRPVADNSKPAERALNRRIEIILVARE